MKNSEIIFSEYLTSLDLFWDYERNWGIRKPDFTVYADQLKTKIIAVVEVEDMEFNKEELADFTSMKVKAIDPYKKIREKINVARKQLKYAKDYPCLLVIRNNAGILTNPLIILGSMMGDVGIRIPINKKSGKLLTDKQESYLGNRGKMINQIRKCPQNTTISAIGVLNTINPIAITSGYEKELNQLANSITDITSDNQTEVYVKGAEKLKQHYESNGFEVDKHASELTFVINPVSKLAFPKSSFENGYTRIHEHLTSNQEFIETYNWQSHIKE